MFSTLLYSYGVVCVTISVFQYATDSFEMYAASAQAGVIMVRYVAAGIMAEFSIMIHQGIKIRGDLSLFWGGGLSVSMVPIPFLLHRYVYMIQKSKYRSQTRIARIS
jgi:hypothetical protein